MLWKHLTLSSIHHELIKKVFSIDKIFFKGVDLDTLATTVRAYLVGWGFLVPQNPCSPSLNRVHSMYSWKQGSCVQRGADRTQVGPYVGHMNFAVWVSATIGWVHIQNDPCWVCNNVDFHANLKQFSTEIQPRPPPTHPPPPPPPPPTAVGRHGPDTISE